MRGLAEDLCHLASRTYSAGRVASQKPRTPPLVLGRWASSFPENVGECQPLVRRPAWFLYHRVVSSGGACRLASRLISLDPSTWVVEPRVPSGPDSGRTGGLSFRRYPTGLVGPRSRKVRAGCTYGQFAALSGRFRGSVIESGRCADGSGPRPCPSTGIRSCSSWWTASWSPSPTCSPSGCGSTGCRTAAAHVHAPARRTRSGGSCR